ncbi:plasmid SOS inhibition protein A [Yersinia sp. 2538 StPb PI]|uniref:plasmid SOS inhibition protein A n=1 Tax=Yersinia sp. 2538 StPb PI TaxID=3117405 RepID=UPI003FA49010
MIPNSMSLVPVNQYQRAAIMAIIAVEEKIQQGRKLGQYPYARELFRHLCGNKGKISASDVRRAASNYDPKNRGGTPKEGFVRALDTLVGSRGEICPLPLLTSDGYLFFPEVRYRLRERQHRQWDVKVARKANNITRERQKKRRRYQAQVAQAEIELAFTTPSELTAWYKRLERQGIYEDDVIGMVQAWSRRFSHLSQDPFLFGCPLWAIVDEIQSEQGSRTVIELWLDELMIPNKLGRHYGR